MTAVQSVSVHHKSTSKAQPTLTLKQSVVGRGDRLNRQTIAPSRKSVTGHNIRWEGSVSLLAGQTIMDGSWRLSIAGLYDWILSRSSIETNCKYNGILSAFFKLLNSICGKHQPVSLDFMCKTLNDILCYQFSHTQLAKKSVMYQWGLSAATIDLIIHLDRTLYEALALRQWGT